MEIACNVESTFKNETGTILKDENSPLSLSQDSQTSLYNHSSYTSPDEIEARVRALARERDVDIVGRALIGFTPDEAFRLAVEALTTGQWEYWKTRNVIMM